MKMFLYAHGGSGNKGCEAIARSVLSIINNEMSNTILISYKSSEDKIAHLDKICQLVQGIKESKKFSLINISQVLFYKIFKSKWLYFILSLSPFYKTNFSNSIALSIGGDNYCYEGSPELLSLHNRKIKNDGGTSVLWGCSITPEVLSSKSVINDMKQYDLIIARESITYNALINAGVTKNTHLYPDPAFALSMEPINIPQGFIINNTVGMNMSPHALDYSSDKGKAYRNYQELIKWIIDNTDMQIALIPHVVKDRNNDIEVMTPLYKQFKGTGRIINITNYYNCMETKYLISKCRFFVGARTHSTIAAYSSCLPTLVLGYSVKARGIARDIFGSEVGYVVETQRLGDDFELREKFIGIYNNEEKIIKHLQNFIPSYIKKAWQAGEEVKKLIEKQG